MTTLKDKLHAKQQRNPAPTQTGKQAIKVRCDNPDSLKVIRDVFSDISLPGFAPQLMMEKEYDLRKCIVCDAKENLQTCNRCNSARYCSKECQKEDWPSHKQYCITKAGINSLNTSKEADSTTSTLSNMIDKLGSGGADSEMVESLRGMVQILETTRQNKDLQTLKATMMKNNENIPINECSDPAVESPPPAAIITRKNAQRCLTEFERALMRYSF